jgi:valyl-tRNA synthetase
VPESASLTINRWILTELARTARDVTEAIETYRFNDAAGSALPLRLEPGLRLVSRAAEADLHWRGRGGEAESQACAAYVLDEIYKLLHPFMPFMTEELWAVTMGEGRERGTLLCHARMAERRPMPMTAAADETNWLIDLVSGIRSTRAEMNVPPSGYRAARGQSVPMRNDRTARSPRSAIRGLPACRERRACGTAPKGLAQIVVGEAHTPACRSAA